MKVNDTFQLHLHEIRRPDSKFHLDVHWWSSILNVKQLIQELTGEPPSRQHIFHATSPTELSNSIMLHDLGIEKSGYMLWIAIDYRSGNDFSIAPAKDVALDVVSKEMIEAVRLGLQRNKPPTATDEFEGSGGVYFMRNSMGSYISVFKPHDEEQGMPNNPKDHVGTGVHGLRDFFTPGQGCLRELAAYIMDVRHFSYVPITTLVHCEHPVFHYPLHHGIHSKQGDPFPKLGSLQEFIAGAQLFEDIGPSLLRSIPFSSSPSPHSLAAVSDFEVQKIALLDMRILNCDRNAANILAVRSDSHSLLDSTESFHYDAEEFVVGGSPHGLDHHHGSYQLIPIDHGYSMPSRLKIVEWDWAWFNYQHVSRPVHPDLIEYMNSLDIDALTKRLRVEANISDDSLFLIRVAHHVLVTGLNAGLTLKNLAVIFVRSGDDEDVPSRLEQAIEEAEDNAFRAIEMKGTRSKAYSPNSSFGSLDEKSSVRSTSSGSTDTQSLDEPFSNIPRPPLFSSSSCSHLSMTRNHLSSSSLSSHSEESSNSLPIPSIGSRGKSWCPSINQLDTIAERRERGMSCNSLSDCDSGPSQAGSFDPKSSGIDMLLKSESYHEGLDEETHETLRTSKQLSASAFSNPSPLKSVPLSTPYETEPVPYTSPLHNPLSGAPLRSLRTYDYHGQGSPQHQPTGSALHNPHAKHLHNGRSGIQAMVMRSEAIQIPSAAPAPSFSHADNSPKSLACFPYGSPYLRESITSQILETPTVEDDYVMCSLGELQDDFQSNVTSTEENYEDILFDVPLSASIPLSRVVSFSGFESRPLYSNPSMRGVGTMRLERRKVIADSSEFQQLRLDFAFTRVTSIIHRLVTQQRDLSIR